MGKFDFQALDGFTSRPGQSLLGWQVAIELFAATFSRGDGMSKRDEFQRSTRADKRRITDIDALRGMERARGSNVADRSGDSYMNRSRRNPERFGETGSRADRDGDSRRVHGFEGAADDTSKTGVSDTAANN